MDTNDKYEKASTNDKYEKTDTNDKYEKTDTNDKYEKTGTKFTQQHQMGNKSGILMCFLAYLERTKF